MNRFDAIAILDAARALAAYAPKPSRVNISLGHLDRIDFDALTSALDGSRRFYERESDRTIEVFAVELDGGGELRMQTWASDGGAIERAVENEAAQ